MYFIWVNKENIVIEFSDSCVLLKEQMKKKKKNFSSKEAVFTKKINRRTCNIKFLYHSINSHSIIHIPSNGINILLRDMWTLLVGVSVFSRTARRAHVNIFLHIQRETLHMCTFVICVPGKVEKKYQFVQSVQIYLILVFIYLYASSRAPGIYKDSSLSVYAIAIYMAVTMSNTQFQTRIVLQETRSALTYLFIFFSNVNILYMWK